MKRILLIVLAFMLAFTASAAEKASLGTFMPAYSAKVKGADMQGLLRLADKKMLNKRMTAEEISDYMGSTKSQSKMIINLSKSEDKKLTPLEFVHFLSEDLFNRKALQMFVKEQEKVNLRHRMKFMDAANAGTQMSASQISALLDGFVLDDTSEATIKSILDGIR